MTVSSLWSRAWAPASVNEVGDEALASYNGVGGGRFWKWYEPGVFEAELQKLGTDFEGCKERECVAALRNTSARIRRDESRIQSGLDALGRPTVLPAIEELEEGRKEVVCK